MDRSRPRLAWVTWRQHRTALITMAVLLAVPALALAVTGLRMQSAAAALNRSGCAQAGIAVTITGHCGHLIDAVYRAGHPLDGNVSLIAICLAVIPGLIGVFIGAPLLAREYEAGTYRFAWTQAASPRRWTLVKLGLLGGVLTAACAAFGWLISWWLLLADGLPAILGSRWSPGQFTLTAVTFAGWALLCFAAGAFVGALLRRVVPAMAVTAGVVAALSGITYWKINGWLVAFDSLVRRTTESFTYSSLANSVSLLPGGGVAASPHGSWPLSTWFTGPHGQYIGDNSASVLWSLKEPAQVHWIASHHLTLWISYQPAGRFWLLQSVEGGACLALALLLGAATAWLAGRQAG